MAKYRVNLDFWIDGEHRDDDEKEIRKFIDESLNGSAYQAENIEVDVIEEN